MVSDIAVFRYKVLLPTTVADDQVMPNCHTKRPVHLLFNDDVIMRTTACRIKTMIISQFTTATAVQSVAVIVIRYELVLLSNTQSSGLVQFSTGYTYNRSSGFHTSWPNNQQDVTSHGTARDICTTGDGRAMSYTFSRHCTGCNRIL